jgi:hypothetical protein
VKKRECASIFLKLSILTVLFVSLTFVNGRADHAERFAHGRPPVVCGGIKLGVTTLKELISQYGNPSAKLRKPDDGYLDRGTVKYSWTKNGLQQTVAMHFVGEYETPIYSIKLERMNLRATGACVFPLGTHINHVVKKYGRDVRITAKFPNGLPSSFDVQWKNGTSLKGTADESGHIFYFHLMAEIE